MHAHAKIEAPVQVHPAIGPHGAALDFVRDQAARGKKRLMIVGHEPDCSILVATLVGKPLVVPFTKAMVAALRVPNEGGDAVVRFTLDPKSLEITRVQGD